MDEGLSQRKAQARIGRNDQKSGQDHAPLKKGLVTVPARLAGSGVVSVSQSILPVVGLGQAAPGGGPVPGQQTGAGCAGGVRMCTTTGHSPSALGRSTTCGTAPTWQPHPGGCSPRSPLRSRCSGPIIWADQGPCPGDSVSHPRPRRIGRRPGEMRVGPFHQGSGRQFLRPWPGRWAGPSPRPAHSTPIGQTATLGNEGRPAELQDPAGPVFMPRRWCRRSPCRRAG